MRSASPRRTDSTLVKVPNAACRWRSSPMHQLATKVQRQIAAAAWESAREARRRQTARRIPPNPERVRASQHSRSRA